jgi:citrate lyase subunit beta/citryl-CoA lyase
MRSLLFVPADSERKIAKALACGADAVILDLEDSVAPDNKPQARAAAAAALEAQRPVKLWVRVNGLDSGLTQADVAAVLAHRPDGVVLPKSQSRADVEHLVGIIRDAGDGADGTPILAIATETAQSLFHMGSYVGATNLYGLTWGMEDLATALGAQANRDEAGQPTEPYRLARTLCLIGARAAGVAPIDAVYSNFRDLNRLEAICREAARDGFTGKMCIHPDQVPVINAAFTPSPEAIARARRILQAFADAGHAGVVGLDGEMLDVPHRKAAQALLRRVTD